MKMKKVSESSDKDKTRLQRNSNVKTLENNNLKRKEYVSTTGT
ncbi:MAG: hypothetical protein ACRDFB_03925 [Rhabdochlamydiaceae bacterium]